MLKPTQHFVESIIFFIAKLQLETKFSCKVKIYLQSSQTKRKVPLTILLLLLLLNPLKPLNILVDVIGELLPQILDVVIELGGEQHHEVHQLLRASLRRGLLLIGHQPDIHNLRHSPTRPAGIFIQGSRLIFIIVNDDGDLK